MRIKEKAYALEPWLIETRQYFHKHPELSLKEVNTTQKIVEILQSFNIEVVTFKDHTGCLGIIRGAKPGKTIAIRSDIDALPIEEENEIDYKSVNPGCMHACGHDAHLTMNLGAAKILNEMKEELSGTIIHVFQPAEEIGDGAMLISNHPWFEEVDEIMGIHIWNDLPAGTINVEEGSRMAAADHFIIDIEGVSGHGAAPHQTIDATIVAAEIVSNLQTLVSRELNPLDALVVSVGRMTSGTAFNVISGSAQLEGTVRYYTREKAETIKNDIQRIVSATALMHNAKATLEYHYYTGPVINDKECVDTTIRAIDNLFGKSVLTDYPKCMLAEDFSYYLTKKPGVFVFLGSNNPSIEAHYPHHNARFNVDESVLKMGCALMAQYAIEAQNDETIRG